MNLSFVVPEDECLVIEYPGFVKNVNSALNTLGDIEKIAKVCIAKRISNLNFYLCFVSVYSLFTSNTTQYVHRLIRRVIS